MAVRADRLASNVNHRLYRQSRVYCTKVDIDADLIDGQYVDVFALADTWYNQKAYQFAKKIFDENGAEESAQLGTSAARWNDFRVDHGVDTVGQDYQAIQYGPGATRFTVDEYFMSEVTNAAGAALTFRWIGMGANTFNIIDQYDATGNTDASPSNAPTTVAYDGLTDELDDNQMEHLSNDGNGAPYHMNSLENQALVRIARLFVDANGTSKLSTAYFDAPCGLVLLQFGGGLTAQNANEKISISLKAGDYKGVHAPSYLE